MIIINDIRKNYYVEKNEVEILKGISLEINDGEFLCIIGASGCGKSTFLNILGLLDVPSSGTYLLDDKNVLSYNEKERAYIRNREIGYVYQAFNLIPELNVAENIGVPLGFAGVKRRDRRRRSEELLDSLNMKAFMRKYPNQLSGGEQQRVAILRAISNHPKLLLADEPTGNLDEANTVLIMNMFKQLNDAGMTIVMVTHDLQIADYASRIVEIKNGIIEPCNATHGRAIPKY